MGRGSGYGAAPPRRDSQFTRAGSQALKATTPWTAGSPSVLIAHTIKGKGVDFMENNLQWHYSSPKPDQLASAIAQLGSQP